MTVRRRQMLAIALTPALMPSLPASATVQAMQHAIQSFTGVNTPPTVGRVQVEIAPLVENGNTVPVAISFDSPMTAADHVKAFALFTPRNPQPDVAIFHLSPRSGRAKVSTRMRFATSQTLVAVAKLSDGSCWQASVDVVVTLAACVEG